MHSDTLVIGYLTSDIEQLAARSAGRQRQTLLRFEISSEPNNLARPLFSPLLSPPGPLFSPLIVPARNDERPIVKCTTLPALGHISSAQGAAGSLPICQLSAMSRA